MKQRKPLNVGDKVKVFGCNTTGGFTSEDNWFPVAYLDDDIVTIFSELSEEYVKVHRRQVYAVKRKKKAVKVISDERFFTTRYTDYLYYSLSATMKEAVISGNEILELGIVARHEVKK